MVVMYYIRNPYGRIVAIDDQDKYEYWTKKEGFSVPTFDEVNDWLRSRQLEYETRERAAHLSKPGNSSVLFATVSGGNDGYGQASRNLDREFTRLGVKSSHSNTGQTIGFLFHAPYSIAYLDTPYRIIYTMFESTKIPDDWREYLKAADLVLVPSKWCQEVFAKGGVKSSVVPLGYDDHAFTYKEHHNRRDAGEVFTFLHYNGYNIRKGFIELIQAFKAEFEPDEPVRLVIKTNLKNPPFPFIKEKYPNIDVINSEVTATELGAICQNADCFVFPSRGEGFGITPLEAMATGCPVIVPNAHGISEYFNDDCMYEVKVGSMCPGIYARYKGVDVGQMYVSDVQHLRSQMRYVYEHQDEAIEKGRRASEYAKRYTIGKTAERLKKIFDDVLSSPLPKRADSNVLSLELV